MLSVKHGGIMAKGPKGEKRPTDVIGNAIKIAKIATGEEDEEFEKDADGKDKAAQSLGKRGGKARAASHFSNLPPIRSGKPGQPEKCMLSRNPALRVRHGTRLLPPGC